LSKPGKKPSDAQGDRIASPVPAALVHSLESLPGFDRALFEQAHADAKPCAAIRINPAKMFRLTGDLAPDAPISLARTGNTPVPWCQEGYYLPVRPSFTMDPLFHAGLYYVQEPSSMSISWLVRQAIPLNQPLKVLDLCAAPGGKSTLLQSLLTSDSLLVANEVIRSRVSVLGSNLTRWGGANTVMTCNDPADFSALTGFFDLIIVDAPCSGSGLFRKDPWAVREWTPQLVGLCSRRQRRILTDVLPALKKGGILIYSTCSYSPAENEEIVAWLINESGLKTLDLPIPESWHVVTDKDWGNEISGMRFYPDKLQGEGFFVSCLRKESGSPAIRIKQRKFQALPGRKRDFLRDWLREDAGLEIRNEPGKLVGFPRSLMQELMMLENSLHVRQSGVDLGKQIREEFIPAPSLALSTLYNEGLPALELDLENAIRYLYKKPFTDGNMPLGWVLVKYAGISLGWAKILPGRINNYYPPSWRILKEQQ